MKCNFNIVQTALRSLHMLHSSNSIAISTHVT